MLALFGFAALHFFCFIPWSSSAFACRRAHQNLSRMPLDLLILTMFTPEHPRDAAHFPLVTASLEPTTMIVLLLDAAFSYYDAMRRPRYPTTTPPCCAACSCVLFYVSVCNRNSVQCGGDAFFYHHTDDDTLPPPPPPCSSCLVRRHRDLFLLSACHSR